MNQDIIIPEYDENAPTDSRGTNQQFKLKFLEQYKVDIDRLLKIALDNSPIKKICFLTGYQLGRLHGNTEIIYTIEDFWEQHNSYGLSINTMYEMYGK